MKRLPPCARRRCSRRPPCASAMALHNARPRPAPRGPLSSRPRTNGSKSRASSSAPIPGPRSATLARRPSGAARDVDLDRSGRMAQGVVEQVGQRLGEQRRVAAHQRQAGLARGPGSAPKDRGRAGGRPPLPTISSSDSQSRRGSKRPLDRRTSCSVFSVIVVRWRASSTMPSSMRSWSAARQPVALRAQRRGCRDDRAERRPQVVRDRGEEGRLQVLALEAVCAARFDAARRSRAMPWATSAHSACACSRPTTSSAAAGSIRAAPTTEPLAPSGRYQAPSPGQRPVPGPSTAASRMQQRKPSTIGCASARRAAPSAVRCGRDQRDRAGERGLQCGAAEPPRFFFGPGVDAGRSRGAPVGAARSSLRARALRLAPQAGREVADQQRDAAASRPARSDARGARPRGCSAAARTGS